MIFKGVCTALVTPFKKDKSIDFLALEKLIKNQYGGLFIIYKPPFFKYR